MHTFTTRDLREGTHELVLDAEAGKLAVVTENGQPLFVAVPFDDVLLRGGVNLALAVRFFDEEMLTLSQAAHLAGMGRMDFMARLAELHIPIARPRPGELERELETFG